MMKPKIKKRRNDRIKKQELILMICCCIIIGLLGSFFILVPTIELKGSNPIQINIYSSYQDPGFSARYLGKNISNKVKINSKVNTEKLGTYQVIYSLKQGPFKIKKIRMVEVADLEGPYVTLTGNEEVLICPGTTYQEEGYQAIDNVDGDISSNVKRIEKDQEIVYESIDKAHNKTIIKRKITIGDTQAPSIELMGQDIMFVSLHTNYQEPGYQAYDNCDGQITDQVKVIGNVDTNTLGEYQLTYQVTDRQNNQTEVKRKIKVIQPGEGGTIYLTFDDGPKSGTTNVILDILKETGVKATFFVTNSGPDDLIRRMATEGHSIGLHTASHNYSAIYASEEAYFNDLQIVHDRVQNLTGIDSRIIRFPGGSSNTVSRKYNQGIMSRLTQLVLQRGYQYYDWNISSGDAGQTTDSNVIYQNVISKLSRNRANMVLMHDVKPYTRDALRRIIDYGKANGYQFEAITMDTKMVQQKINN